MKPYRPIELEKIDEDFFSSGSETSDEQIQEKQTENTVFTNTDSENQGAVLHPSLTPDVIEGLMKLKSSSQNTVFHNLPEDEEPAEKDKTDFSAESAQKPVAPSKRKPEISEEEALKSFPDFDFDPTLFEQPEYQEAAVDNNAAKREEIKEYKEKAKQEIKAEKEKIREQKILEKKIQRPFKSRRFLILGLIASLLIGLIAASAVTAVYLTGNTVQTAFTIQNYSLCYIDGENIISSEAAGSLVAFSNESVTSSKMIIFSDGERTRAEPIVAIGDGICAVIIDNKTHPIPTADINGVVSFSIGNMKSFYDFVHTKTIIAFAAILLYFSLVIVGFAAMIASKNKKIKNYRENYQLVR